MAEDIISILRPMWKSGEVFTTNTIRETIGRYDVSVEVVYLKELVKAKLLKEERVSTKEGRGDGKAATILKFTVATDNPHDMANRLYLFAAKRKKCERKKGPRSYVETIAVDQESEIKKLRKEKESLELDLQEMKDHYDELEEKCEKLMADSKKATLNGVSYCPKCHLNIKKYAARISDIIKECEV